MVSLLIILSASVFLSSYILQCLAKGINSTVERIGADIIVVPRGYASSVSDALFTGEACTVYFQNNWLDNLESIEGIDEISAQLFLASLAQTPCCDSKSQLIAIDTETDFVVQPWINETYHNDLKKGEVIVGSNMTYEVGGTATFFGQEYNVVAKLTESGMGYDRSVFLNYESAEELLANPKVNYNFAATNKAQAVSAYYVKIVDGYDIEELQERIENEIDGEEIQIFTSSSLVSGVKDNLNKYTGIGNMIAFLVLLMGILSVAGIFSITVYERKKEFGILYALGGTRIQVVMIILGEAIAISILGCLAGVICGEILVLTFGRYVSIWFAMPFLRPNLLETFIIVGKSFSTTFGAAIIAAFIAIIKINGTEPYWLIKENEA